MPQPCLCFQQFLLQGQGKVPIRTARFLRSRAIQPPGKQLGQHSEAACHAAAAVTGYIPVVQAELMELGAVGDLYMLLMASKVPSCKRYETLWKITMFNG